MSQGIPFDEERVANLLLELRAFYKAHKGNTHAIEAATPVLRTALCKATKLIVPDARQKIDEYIIAEKKGLTVRKEKNGADMTDGDDRHYESKAGVVNAKTMRCNIHWEVPYITGQDPQDMTRRDKMIESIRNKCQGGGVYITLHTETRIKVAEYYFHECFLIIYFRHIKITEGVTKTHNMGCDICKQCHTYHRLELMRKLDDEMVTNPEFTFDASHPVYKGVSSQCN